VRIATIIMRLLIHFFGGKANKEGEEVSYVLKKGMLVKFVHANKNMKKRLRKLEGQLAIISIRLGKQSVIRFINIPSGSKDIRGCVLLNSNLKPVQEENLIRLYGGKANVEKI
jgi:hypothetical protein